MSTVATTFTALARPRPDRARAAGLGGILVIAALLPGCAGTDYGSRAYAVQNKFFYMDCGQLAHQRFGFQKQVEEYEGLERRAARGSGGGFLGNVAYGPQLAQARAEVRLIGETQADKHCDQTPAADAPAKAAAPVAPTTGHKAQSSR